MAQLKSEVDQVNMSTVCDKRELELGVSGPKLRYSQVAHMLIQDSARALGRRIAASFRRMQPVYVRPDP